MIFFGIAKEVQYTDFDFYSLYVLSYIQEIFAKCKLMTFYPILFSGSFFFKFYFYFILLYNTVLVLPYIDMNSPQVYMSSQS